MSSKTGIHPMRKHPCITILLTICTVASCSRSNDETAEMKALREEVKSLRTELEHQRQTGPNVTTQALAVVPEKTTVVSSQLIADVASDASSPEFVEFVRISRRMVSAINSGVNYQDFGQRLVDVNATAEETLSKLTESPQRTNVVNFVLALQDARNLWSYKLNLGTDRLPLQSISKGYAPMNFPEELGDRWNLKFDVLVKKYELVDLPSSILDYGIQKGAPVLILDRALERILSYATKTFREIEKSK